MSANKYRYPDTIFPKDAYVMIKKCLDRDHSLRRDEFASKMRFFRKKQKNYLHTFKQTDPKKYVAVFESGWLEDFYPYHITNLWDICNGKIWGVFYIPAQNVIAMVI